MKKILKIISLAFLVIIVAAIFAGGGLGHDNKKNQLNQGKPLIFAHRGVTNSMILENTSISFAKSDSLNFKAIETDICSTKDGKLLIFHDKSGERLLGINSKIKDLNWEEIKNTPLFLNNKPTKSNILSLDKFLSQTDTAIILYLDLKVSSKAIIDSLLIILAKYPDHKNIIVADQKIAYLVYLKSRNTNLRVCLEGISAGKEWLYYVIPKKFKPDYCSSFLSDVNKNHIKFLKRHNVLNRKITYGVNQKNLQTVFGLGIQNIILDYSKSMGSVDSIHSKLLINFNSEKHLNSENKVIEY